MGTVVELDAGERVSQGAALIDGKGLAKRLTAELGAKLRNWPKRPGLAVVLVGDDPASQVYVANKARTAQACGLRSSVHRFDGSLTQSALLETIAELNADPEVDGILVQLPLPDHLDEAAAIAAIDPVKDVDGLHVANAGKLAVGDPSAMVPCTPRGICALIDSVHGPSLAGLDAVVLGRSRLVGVPVARLLTSLDATVTLAHSRTANLPSQCKRADILVAAVGRPELVRGDWIKPGATVIDVGINRVTDASAPKGSRLVGDVAFEEAVTVAGAITPVPGGVGPMTIAMLMDNTVIAASRSADARS